MDPLVSILIPAYNAEKWIIDTIQSALAQTWPNKEIIIVDDGSSDNTLRIIKEFESKSVKVITQANRGSCNARNRALSASQGDFIQWLDADDLLDPNKITLQLKNNDNIPETRTLYSCSWGRFYFRPKKAKCNPNSLWQDLSPLNWLIKSFGEEYIMPNLAWLVSRKLTEMAGLWDERLTLNDDGEYFCRVVAASEWVKFVPKAQCYYRIGNYDTISHNRSKKALESLFLSLDLCIDHILALERNSITKMVCANMFQTKWKYYQFYSSPEIISAINKRIVNLGGIVSPPKESREFSFIQKMFGWQTAMFFKKWFWRIKVLFIRSWDQLIAKIDRNKSSIKT